MFRRRWDFYSRIGIGQLEILKEHPVVFTKLMEGTRAQGSMSDADGPILFLKNILFGFGEGASHGIYNPEVPDAMRQAWDITKVIRHHLAMESVGWPANRDYKTMFGVNFDPPDQASTEQPLPTMKIVKQDENNA